MIHHDHGIIVGLNKAEAWLRHHRSLDVPVLMSIKGSMPQPKSVKTILSWLSGLFLRDGRPLEFFSAVGILGWALLSDISTGHNIIAPSLDGAVGLISPDNMVWIGYILGALQLVALATLRRWLRAPIAFALSVFLGVLTQGVWEGQVHSPGSALYGMVWAMNGYIFVRLCRPRP